MADNLTKCLARVRGGEIDFCAFVRATMVEFQNLAKNLIRRWAPPPSYTIDDVVQDLRVGAWRVLYPDDPTKEWDPKRGVSLRRFFVWNTMSYAKRKLHKARGAKLSGTADKNPSRLERSISSLGRTVEDAEAFAETILAIDPIAEATMIAHEERISSVEIALAACENADERVAIVALDEGGDLASAGALLHGDFGMRVALRLGSEEQAMRYVMRGVGAVAARLNEIS